MKAEVKQMAHNPLIELGKHVIVERDRKKKGYSFVNVTYYKG